MAARKSSSTASRRMTVGDYRYENEKLKDKIEKIEAGSYCPMCDTFKDKDKFYINTNPIYKSGVSLICKQCAKNIAEMVDKRGNRYAPTRESIIKALKYLDKPFLESVYNASVQESENIMSGRPRGNAFLSYVKNIALPQYSAMTFDDSDIFREDAVEQDEILTEEDLKNKNEEVYNQYAKDKEDVIRLIGYDPFVKEPVDDQPLLYSQFLGMIDSSSEDVNDDMLRISSIITIVRSFSQIAKLDDAITRLMSDYNNLERNAAAIKSLQESKQKIQAVITNLAAESCISLKNSKNAKKGENTWTGKMKKLKDLNLRDSSINGFDIGTCKGMQQVADISMNAILRSLKLDDSEYSEIVAEQRKKLSGLTKEAESYHEAVRILLKENLDLRDTLKENGLINEDDLISLDDLVDTYIVQDKKKEE